MNHCVRGALALALLAGCWSEGTKTCADGVLCPVGMECAPLINECVSPAQLESCRDLDDGASCAFEGLAGSCASGVCVAFQCGNGVVEPGESCELESFPSCLDFGFDRGLASCPLCSVELVDCDTIGWDRQTLSATPFTNSISVYGESRAYMVYDGSLLHLQEGSWSPVTAPEISALGPSSLLSDVKAVAETNVFVVGSTIAETFSETFAAWFDGQSWATQRLGSSALTAVDAVSPSAAIAVGVAGVIVEFENNQWSVVPESTGFTADMRDIYLSSASSGFAVGAEADAAALLRLEAGVWSVTTLPQAEGPLWGVHGRGDSDVFVVGDDGAAWHWDGNEWTDISLNETASLRGVYARAGEVIAVGVDQAIFHYDGNSWIRTMPAETTVINHVDGFGDTVLASGQSAAVYDYPGMAWAVPLETSGNFLRLWGPSTDAVWVSEFSSGFLGAEREMRRGPDFAVASGQELAIAVAGRSAVDVFAGYQAQLKHFDGATWEVVAAAPASILGIAATDDHVFTIHDNGVLVQYDGDGTNPVAMQVPWSSDVDLTDIFRLDQGFVVAGTQGTLGHFDGATLTLLDSGTTEDLTAVWAGGPNHIFYGGVSGTLYRRDENGSRVVALPLSEDDVFALPEAITDIHGTSPEDIFVTGQRGSIYLFDGSGWSFLRSPADSLNAVWVLPSQVYFVGYNEFHRLVRRP